MFCRSARAQRVRKKSELAARIGKKRLCEPARGPHAAAGPTPGPAGRQANGCSFSETAHSWPADVRSGYCAFDTPTTFVPADLPAESVTKVASPTHQRWVSSASARLTCGSRLIRTPAREPWHWLGMDRSSRMVASGWGSGCSGRGPGRTKGRSRSHGRAGGPGGCDRPSDQAAWSCRGTQSRHCRSLTGTNTKEPEG